MHRRKIRQVPGIDLDQKLREMNRLERFMILSHLCCRCSAPMTIFSAIPRLGALPELHTYRCERCGEVETIEVADSASAERLRCIAH